MTKQTVVAVNPEAVANDHADKVERFSKLTKPELGTILKETERKLAKCKKGGAAHTIHTANIEALQEVLDIVPEAAPEQDDGDSAIDEVVKVAVSEALHAEANEVFTLAVAVDAQRGALSEAVIKLADDCGTWEVYEAAMDIAYADYQAPHADAVIPGSLMNLKSIIKWALVNDELHDENGVLRGINQLKKRKLALKNVVVAPTTEETGEEADDTSKIKYEGCEDLRAAKSAIAELNTIAGTILKGDLSGDTLAQQKAKYLNDIVNDAIESYNDYLTTLVADSSEMAEAMTG